MRHWHRPSKRGKRFGKSIALAVLLTFSMACSSPAGTAVDSILSKEVPTQQTVETAEQALQQEENGMQKIEVQVGNVTFTATLYDTKTAQAFVELLPVQLTMYELNGNEKYAYLAQRLPTEESWPKAIHAGDLMLFGSDCLVLFYENFSTSYRYTPVGYLDAPEDLAQTLGEKNVTVTFRLADQKSN